MLNSYKLQDVQLQMDAKLWGEEFNRHNPPKKVKKKAINQSIYTSKHITHYLIKILV